MPAPCSSPWATRTANWNTLVPGHYNLDKVAEYVKNGIYAAGGTAVEFGTIAACDGVAQGHEGMHYILPSREIICDSVEIMAQAHRLDGLVLLASCDKIVPAMLMAAARLDIPCIVCVGGPMLGGIEFDGRKSDLTSISEALGMLKAGKITECEYNSLENTACPGCGSCSFLGTANTMCCVSEALGMTLPGGALIPAAYAGRLRHSFESGRAIVELCKKGITARQILTKEAIRNAIKVTMAICGSTNAVLHLPAIANEAELDMNVLEEFEALTKTTPQIAKVNPAAKPEMEAFYRAGGIPRVMQHLGGLLDTSVMTVSGKTLAENLAGYVYEYPEDPTIIKTVEEPFSKTGGVAVLHGNLCPRTAVSKPGAIDPSMHRFVGKAKCYNSEEEAEEAILGGKIQAGDVVVIRYEGPKGAYPIGPVSDRPLFWFHARKLLGLKRTYGAPVPFYVMTSETNDAATRALFEANDYFGLDRQDVFFFVQGMWPALDPEGRIILDKPGHIFMSPDGHGGTLAALERSGALADMARRGIGQVFFFQVDNPMVDIADPLFVGLHAAKGADMTLKVCKKRDAHEGMGVVVIRDGAYAMVEYSELSDEQMERTNPDGTLWLAYGSPAIHMFSYAFLKAEAERAMPLHLAHKKIAMVDEAGQVVKPAAPNGYKFEKFIFDVIPNAKTLVTLAFDRTQEFSPVKNAEGNDSPATTKRDLQAKWRRWLAQAGVTLPDGLPVEIDPAYALNAAQLQAKGLQIG